MMNVISSPFMMLINRHTHVATKTLDSSFFLIETLEILFFVQKRVNRIKKNLFMYKTADHVINKCRPINTNLNSWGEVKVTA